MQKAPKTNFIKIFIVMMAGAVMSSCHSRAEKFYNQAQEKISESKFLEAVDLLEDSADLEKNNRLWSKTNFEIAKILRLDIQDYNKAIVVYKKLILSSEDLNLRLASQEAITEIYFDNLQDYTNALKELQILEPLTHDKKKLESIRLKIAQCYRYTGNYKAAQDTIESALLDSVEQKSYLLKIKAEILVHLNKNDEAIVIYNEILRNDPLFFKKENLYVAEALAFENKQDYKAALLFLQQNKQNILDPSLYELKIKRLDEKIKNKPFSRGIRK